MFQIKGLIKKEVQDYIENFLSKYYIKNSLYDTKIKNEKYGMLQFQGPPDEANLKKVFRNCRIIEIEPLKTRDGFILNFGEKFPVKIQGQSKSYSVFLIQSNENLEDKIFIIVKVKGGKSIVETTTDQKELAVILFYEALKSQKAEKYDDYTIDFLIQIARSFESYPHIDDKKHIQKMIDFLNEIDFEDKKSSIFFQSVFNQAKLIYHYYPRGILFRGEVYHKIRKLVQQKINIFPDKWNPGDIYLLINGTLNELNNLANEISTIENSIKSLHLPENEAMVLINNLFVDELGAVKSYNQKFNLAAFSLKLTEKVIFGKATSFLKILNPKDKSYTLSKQELRYTENQLVEEIQKLRKELNVYFNKNNSQSSVKFDISNFLNTPLHYLNQEQLLTKYGAYKILKFLFENSSDKINYYLVFLRISGFGLSVTGINPTFFVVDGTSNKIKKMPRGQILSMADDRITFNETLKSGSITYELKVNLGELQYEILTMIRRHGHDQLIIENNKVKLLN